MWLISMLCVFTAHVLQVWFQWADSDMYMLRDKGRDVLIRVSDISQCATVNEFHWQHLGQPWLSSPDYLFTHLKESGSVQDWHHTGCSMQSAAGFASIVDVITEVSASPQRSIQTGYSSRKSSTHTKYALYSSYTAIIPTDVLNFQSGLSKRKNNRTL
jgi:hypothetical protein